MFNGKTAVFEVVEKGKLYQPSNAGSLSKLEVGDLFYLEYPFTDWSKIGGGFYSPSVITHVFVDGEWSDSYGYLSVITKSFDDSGFVFKEVGSVEEVRYGKQK